MFLFLIVMPAESSDLSTRNCSEKNINFVVPIPVEAFSHDAVIKARLWNSEQLEISRKNSVCMAFYDVRTKVDGIRCPKGVEYQKVTPEEFSFPIQRINTTIKIRSSTIRMGKKYRLLISGLSNDDCNMVSAEIRDVVNTKIITIEQLSWRRTEMACLSETKSLLSRPD